MRCAVVTLLTLNAVAASAQGRSITEAISVPDGATCLTRASVAEHTRAWLGTDTLDGDLTILLELGTGERDGAGFVLLEGDRPRARRVFERLPEACADRRAALSLALAIALDAGVLDRLGVAPPSSAEPEASPPAAPAPAIAPAPTPPPEDRAELAPDRRGPGLRVQLGLDAGLSFGALPRYSGWGAIGLGVGGEGWELRLAGWGTTVARSALGAGRVRAQLAGGALEACLRRRARRVGLAGCAGARGGRVFAEGRGYDMPRATRLWWVAVAGGIEARWPAEAVVSVRLGLRAHVKVVRPVLREIAPDGRPRHEERLSLVGMTPSVGVVVALR